MSRHLFSLPLIFIQLLLTAFVSCSISVTGTGTDTSTRDVYATVNGVILDESKKPLANSIVTLVPSEYNPVTDSSLFSFACDTTDKNGNYSVSSKRAGTYNVIAISDNNSRISIRKKVSLAEKKTYTLTSDTVKSGKKVTLYPNRRILGDSSILFFKGSLIKAKASDSISFVNLPNMTTSLCYSGKSTPVTGVTLKDSINTESVSHVNLFTTLIICKNPTDSGNRLIFDRFKKLGYDTLTSDGVSLQNVNFSGVDLVFIAPSTDGKNYDSTLKTIGIPVVNCKHVFFNKMDFTGSDGELDFGNSDARNSLYIVNTKHPITSGVSSPLQVFSIDKTMNFGNVANSSLLAASDDSLTEVAFFIYEKNQMMTTIKAPARRVGFFVDTNHSLLYMNENGWLLFDRTILWAVGRI